MENNTINKGMLFINDKKGNEKAPDYKGKLDVNGKTYNLSGWVNTSKQNGTKYLSLSINEFTPKEATAPSKKQIEDDLPF